MEHHVIVDLFCGCGGFALGAEMAGFECRVAVDIDSTLQSSYHLNFPRAQVINADITKLDRSHWSLLLKSNSGHGIMRPAGVIGGPPCQGFSRIGHRNATDPRNALIKHYFRHIDFLRPKFFVMENVDGLLDEGTVDVLMSSLQDAAKVYRILDPIIVKASDYGAPTTRTRVIIVGYDPHEMNPLLVRDFLPSKDIPKTTVRDAIGDLPDPYLASRKPGDYAWAKYQNARGQKLSMYAKRARTLPSGDLGDKVAIAHLKRRLVSGVDITEHTDPVRKRFLKLKPGEIDSISKCPKLEWDGFCPTLRAGTGPDKGSFQSVRPLHPETPRVITVREAARLQGFPDWFLFHETKWNSFRMIGNSVSPIVASFVLRAIAKKLSPEIALIQRAL